MEETKTCTVCKQTLPVTMFSWKNKAQQIRHGTCKTCANAQIKRSFRRRIERDPIRYRCDTMHSSAKDRAEKAGIEFTMTHEHVYELAKRPNCPITNIPFDWKLTIEDGKQGSHSDNSPSVDRIDSRFGYTNENTWLITFRMNKIKNDATPQELAMISQAVNNEIMDRICNGL